MAQGGMVDLHSHILYGLDDGPVSFEESVEMVRLAARTGTTDLVASPHANLQFPFQPEAVERKLEELRQACGGSPRLHPGCDFHLTLDNIADALANPRKYTINHRNYLLVEFSDLLIPKTTDDNFARMLDAGIVPIVTHPERNFLLHRRVEQMTRWAGMGCLMQVTAQSFLGRFGREVRDFSRELMRLGLVHVVASDAHDTEDRPPRLDRAFQHVTKRYGAAVAERLFVANPAAVLAGEPLPEPPPPDPDSGPPRRWYKFWKASPPANNP
jgi:protein-tyrosine phosphatase